MSKQERKRSMGLGGAFESSVREIVSELIQGDAINDLIREAIANKAEIPRVVRLEYLKADGKLELLEKQHKLFPLMIAALSAGVPMALIGAAGSGKTSMCLNAAKVIETDAYLVPFNPLTSKTDLLGYCDANGRYVPSALYLAFTKGGVFVADEFDAADPGIAVILNSIIANRICTFPNGETKKAHDKFTPVCCMNTMGTGATTQYVGRNALDAATLDRFAVLKVGYDDSLEAHMLGLREQQEEVRLEDGGVPSSTRVLKLVRAARNWSMTNKWYNIISPRASLLAERLASAGIGERWIYKMVLYRTLTIEQIKSLESHLTSAWPRASSDERIFATPKVEKVKERVMVKAIEHSEAVL